MAGGIELRTASDPPPPDGQSPGLFASAVHVRAILGSLPGAVLVVDKTGKILAFSSAAERMFGHAEAEIVGAHIGRLLTAPDSERHSDGPDAMRKSRVTTARHRDGRLFPIDLHVAEVEIDGEPVFTGFARDLSEMKFRDVQSELAHAARRNAVSGLATAIAHEMNQPLTAIVNYVHTLREMFATARPEQRPVVEAALDDCIEQALRAGRIVRRLREFVARPVSPRQIESLARVVDEASALAMVGGRYGGINVQMALDPEADRVKIGRIEVQQVVLNLVLNAAQALVGTPDPNLLIRSARMSNGQICVSIEDNGPGVAADVAARIFQPFVSTRIDGMGLGLAISQDIVESYGGRIWTDRSSLGGAAFHFTLPDAGAA